MRSKSLLVRRHGPTRLAFGVLFIALHVLATVLFKANVELVSAVFIVAAPLLAAGACLRAAYVVDAGARPGWIFVVFAMLVWASGAGVATVADLVRSTPAVAASAPEFLFFFYGAATLLAVTWTEHDALGGAALWFDGILATLATFLAYLAIFHVVPFSQDKIQPIRAALLVPTYDIENAILVALATLRLIGRTPTPTRWVFDRSMLAFAVIYGLMATIYNHVLTNASGVTEPGPHDVIIDIPFLLLAGIAGGPGSDRSVAPGRRSFVAIFVDSAGPIFFTSMVLTFGAIVAPHHVALGVCGIILALMIYGARSALLQSLYLHTQEALAEARDHLERLALEDSLTQVANRRHLDSALQTSWDLARRNGQPLSFLLLDVDHFKDLNDHKGHQAGDDCLVRLAASLQAAVSRPTDLVARYGGEEFALLLPDTDLNGAMQVAEQLRAAIRDLQIPNETSEGRYLTVSIGVACVSFASHPTVEPYATVDALVIAADCALYAAKRAGRDRAVCAPPPTIEPVPRSAAEPRTAAQAGEIIAA